MQTDYSLPAQEKLLKEYMLKEMALKLPKFLLFLNLQVENIREKSLMKC